MDNRGCNGLVFRFYLVSSWFDLGFIWAIIQFKFNKSNKFKIQSNKPNINQQTKINPTNSKENLILSSLFLSSPILLLMDLKREGLLGEYPWALDT